MSFASPEARDLALRAIGNCSDDDGWRMKLGSCLDPKWGLITLADKSIDVTVTDPPYEAEAHQLGRRQKGKHTVAGREEFREVKSTPLKFGAIAADERAEVARQIARVTKHRALVFCQAEAIDAWRKVFNAAGMPYRRAIPWVKPDAMPSLHGLWPGQAWEAIVLAQHVGADACPIGGKAVYFRGHYECVRERGKQPHETTKPLELMRAIVEDFTRPGELVLDAFAGSGTTGVACRLHGRRFVGWELAACARCSSTALWHCSWLEGKKRQQQSAFLCDVHRDEVSARDGFTCARDNYFEIACRRLRGEEAMPNPAQLSLLTGAA